MKAFMFPMLRDDFQLVEKYKVSGAHLHLPGDQSVRRVCYTTHRGDHHTLVQHVVESNGGTQREKYVQCTRVCCSTGAAANVAG